MSGRSRSYKDGLYRRLKDNAEAVNYLQAALEDSQSAFLVALKNVLEARNVTAIARASDLDRVHIYRMLSEGGNPTLNSMDKILHALGLKLAIDVEDVASSQPTNVTNRVFRISWNVPLAHKRKAFVYAPLAGNSRACSSSLEQEMIGCEQMLSASAEFSYADVLHPAFIPENEEVFEMAY
jgi:probable addiction module antidote protein